MKISQLATLSAAIALLAAPLSAFAGSDFETAKQQAIAEINKASAVGFEWRDSRKILEQAEKAEKAGDHEKAMKLVKQAGQQGMVAVAQAESQKNAGPH
ncbi:MAG: SoxXA-binding protein [Gammaproteobacteria bacterium]|jgi:hypothetical protein